MFISHLFWNKGLITNNKIKVTKVLPDDSDRKSLPKMRETWVWSLDREISWRREWQPTPLFLPRKSHGQRKLDRGDWQTPIHAVTKSQKGLRDSHANTVWPHGKKHARLFCPYYLPEFGQTHIHWVSDAIQPSWPLSSPFSSCLQSFPASGSFPMSQIFQLSG